MPSNIPITESGLFAAKKQAQALQNQNALLIDSKDSIKSNTVSSKDEDTDEIWVF